ncbi:MAG TPA: cation diffusion facilitator family transporter [Jatrophihabitans sp.]|nr:cation diffusion facilitator family transporter [Jatrophihabitans sp.]
MSAGPGHSHGGHPHGTGAADRRWLAAALAVIVAFMLGEVVAGLLSHSLALITDAGHMLTDAASLALALIAARLVRRPAAGAYTYGFTRVDALSAQANGITLVLLAIWFTVAGIRRLIQPPAVHGGPVVVVALVGVAVNVLAVWLAGRADRSSLNVRGAIAHLVSDLWAFLATALAGGVILLTGWGRADAMASLVVAALMTVAGVRLIRAAGRIFLEAAPLGTDPSEVGRAMAAVPGVREVHDLHVWDLGAGDAALSAHLVVDDDFDCHEVSSGVRRVLASRRIGHATLQADHRHAGRPLIADDCARHGPGYLGDGID